MFAGGWGRKREGKEGVRKGEGNCGEVEEVGEVMKGGWGGLQCREGEKEGCVGKQEMKDWGGLWIGERGKRIGGTRDRRDMGGRRTKSREEEEEEEQGENKEEEEVEGGKEEQVAEKEVTRMAGGRGRRDSWL